MNGATTAAARPPAPTEEQHRSSTPTLREIAHTFLRLGCLSFGGPVAHLAYVRRAVVEERRWVDDARYADLVALCQFLPGPASSQVVFAIGLERAGLLGALVASTCFTLPSALVMIALAYGLADAPGLGDAGWLHGLRLAAVAVVAQAVRGMGVRLCTDGARVTLCVGAAAALLVAPGALMQFGVVAAAALVGLSLGLDHGAPARGHASATSPGPTHRAAALALTSCVGLFFALPGLAAATGARPLAVVDVFYRAGALVFGGGHVVLPLLRAELVPRGWLGDDAFLAGYAAAQALPGPMFTFAAYLGAAMELGIPRWCGGLACLLAIFTPGWLMVVGARPFWHRLREGPRARAALGGANAAVVGVLLAALYDPIITESLRGPRDAAAALVAFALLEHGRAAPWLVVGALAAAGEWWLAG